MKRVTVGWFWWLWLLVGLSGCGGGGAGGESEHTETALRGARVTVRSPYVSTRATLYAFSAEETGAVRVAVQDGVAATRVLELYREVDDSELPEAARYFVILEGAGRGGPGQGVLACIGPEVRFTTALVEVDIPCDAGTAAAYSAAYGVADREAEAERLYTVTLEREVAEAWLSLGVFPDAVALPAKPVRGVLGLAALAYAAVLSEAPELLGPTQADAVAWLNEVVWESLRRLDQNGQVTFEEVAQTGTEFLAGVLDVSAVVHAQLDTLYPQVAGLLGFSRFEAENLVQNGQPVVLDTQPPQPVQGLVVSPRPQGAVLRWQPNPLASRYRIYVDFQRVAESEGFTYTLTGLTEPRPYDIGVSAVNRFGESAQTTATVTPVEPPEPVAIQAALEDGVIRITWAEGRSDDPSARIRYVLTRNGRVIFEGTRTEYLDLDVQPGSTYVYTVVVVANEQRSEPSTAVVRVPAEETQSPGAGR